MNTDLTKEEEKIGPHIAVPNLVMAIARDPYDFGLWYAVKWTNDIYGDCHISADQLAKKSKMSVGKVVESRKYWIGIGLLAGEVKRVENDMRQVGHSMWNLWIPDFLELNARWCNAHSTIEEKLKWANEMNDWLDSHPNIDEQIEWIKSKLADYTTEEAIN